MEAVLARYLQERSVSVEAQTVHGLEFAMRHLIGWVAVQHPTIDSFARLAREHVLEAARDPRRANATGAQQAPPGCRPLPGVA